MLLAQRASYIEDIEQLRSTAAEMQEESQTLDVSDDEDLGEANSSRVERDRLLTLATAARKGLEDVDAALARMDAGTYGTCQDCGEAIPPARLEALPAAARCVRCQGAGTRLGSGPGGGQLVGLSGAASRG